MQPEKQTGNTVLLVRDPGLSQVAFDAADAALGAAGYHVVTLALIDAHDDMALVAEADAMVVLLGENRATALDTWMGVAVASKRPVFAVASSPDLRLRLNCLERPALFLQPWPTVSVDFSMGQWVGWPKLLAVMALERQQRAGTLHNEAWNLLADALEGPQG